MHTHPHTKTGVYAISGTQSGVYIVQTLGSWLVKWPLAETLLERFFVCPCLASRHLVWGTLDLDALQKLIHQGYLLCKGACELYNLSRQVLFAIRIGRAWKECISLSSGSVVDFGREIRIGECQICREMW
ncbi:hypothetical protein ACFXTN_008512 [Malus domestica]